MRKVVVIADMPGALVELCGVTLLERLLRILERVGIREVEVISDTPEVVAPHVARTSFARRNLRVAVRRADNARSLDFARDDVLLRADRYYDARLIRALIESEVATEIVESDAPNELLPLFAGLTKTDRGYVSGSSVGEPISAVVDAATFPKYARELRRELRPVWFPAPSQEHRTIAERVIIDAAQKGTLDFPAYVHAPIEKWIVARLCRLSITPNQITLFGFVIACTVTAQYAFGNFVTGAVTALMFGIIDGLDGKQARVKIETSEVGEWEHELDYAVETSWWIALGLFFWRSNGVAHALPLLFTFLAIDLLQRIGRTPAKRALGRDIDDATPFDRALRFVAGRRNVFTWIFYAFVLAAAPARGFVALCCWGIATHLVILAREGMVICARRT